MIQTPKKSTTNVVWNSLNADSRKRDIVPNSMPSMTVPDQTMSIREIAIRYAHGLPFTDAKTPIYDGEEYVPDFSKMDLADKQSYILDLKNEYDDIMNKVKETDKAKKDKKTEEFFREKFQKELNSKKLDDQIKIDPPTDLTI
jgi:hypothetical protein